MGCISSKPETNTHSVGLQEAQSPGDSQDVKSGTTAGPGALPVSVALQAAGQAPSTQPCSDAVLQARPSSSSSETKQQQRPPTGGGVDGLQYAPAQLAVSSGDNAPVSLQLSEAVSHAENGEAVWVKHVVLEPCGDPDATSKHAPRLSQAPIVASPEAMPPQKQHVSGDSRWLGVSRAAPARVVGTGTAGPPSSEPPDASARRQMMSSISSISAPSADGGGAMVAEPGSSSPGPQRGRSTDNPPAAAGGPMRSSHEMAEPLSASSVALSEASSSGTDAEATPPPSQLQPGDPQQPPQPQQPQLSPSPSSSSRRSDRRTSMPALAGTPTQSPLRHASSVQGLPAAVGLVGTTPDGDAAADITRGGATASLAGPGGVPLVLASPLPSSALPSRTISTTSSDAPSATSARRPLRALPSRLSLAAGPRVSLDVPAVSRQRSGVALLAELSSTSLTTRQSCSGALGGRGTSPSPSGSGSNLTLTTLQRAVEDLVMQDTELLNKVQSSMRGISSLAKETTALEVGRDATGATCINQYVVVKTLGRGSFGKVKLCLNTLDGCLYAVKMVNRLFIIRQLQKPQKGLRRRVPTRNASSSTIPAPAVGPGSVVLSGLSGTDLPRPNFGTLNSGGFATPGGTGGGAAPFMSEAGSGASFGVRRPASAAQQTEYGHIFNGGTSNVLSSSRMSVDEGGGHALDSVMREIAVLKKMDHPNVVKLHEVIDPPGASYMMLVMEYMERGPVQETKTQTGFSSFPERIARDYFRQACAGLDYLHYNNVVHGDLKPENLLVNSAGQLKIGDFGSARMMSDSTANAKVSSTPAFQPPEALVASGLEDPHAADVWALGVCLYCFIFGRLPFTGNSLLEICDSIRLSELTFPPDIPITAELQHLLARVLDKDPGQRASLLEVMGHAWTTDRGAAPLPSLRSLLQPPQLVEVSRNEAQAAIKQYSLVSLLRARLKEKTFTPGEFLFREGEEAHCIYMIMSGVVEITSRLAAGGEQAALPPDQEQSFSVDLDESFTLDCSALTPAGVEIKDGKLHIDRHKAQALRDRMRDVLLGKQTEYVTEVKGPGQVIGDVGLDKAAVARHGHSARARDHVTVVKLTEEAFLKAVFLQQQAGSGVADELTGPDTDVALPAQRAPLQAVEDADCSREPVGSATLATIADGDVVDVASL